VRVLPLFAAVAIFVVMFALGLLLGREHLRAALQRRMVVAAIVFAVLVPVPVLAVGFVKLLGLGGPVAAGIVLMSISPGAPIALRRVLEVGGRTTFAPALHLAIVLLAVVTVPFSMAVMNAIFHVRFAVSPADIGRQVLLAQLLPVGLGVAVRAFRPALARGLAPRLARLSNVLFVALIAVCLVVLWPRLVEIGWTPLVAGVLLTTGALGVGAAFAGRDARARPPAAIAAGMRNPGLALLIATVNGMPAAVTAAVFSYAIGAALVVTTYVVWQRRRDAAHAEVV
jgi:BASS family bile acid:Na+ symporter